MSELQLANQRMLFAKKEYSKAKWREAIARKDKDWAEHRMMEDLVKDWESELSTATLEVEYQLSQPKVDKA